jgi:hypothetical protein
MFATSKNLDLILKHSYGTLATCQEHRCNMCTMICNINEKRLHGERLQHAKEFVATPIYNNCNIENTKNQKKKTRGGRSSLRVRPRQRRELPRDDGRRGRAPPRTPTAATGAPPCHPPLLPYSGSASVAPSIGCCYSARAAVAGGPTAQSTERRMRRSSERRWETRSRKQWWRLSLSASRLWGASMMLWCSAPAAGSALRRWVACISWREMKSGAG